MLFAWLHSQFNVRWDNKSSGPSKGEFMEFMKQKLDKYRAYSNYPHYPTIGDIYYNHPDLPQSDGSKLEQFLDFFRPASNADRELIKAFLLTLVWGGPTGKRPGFIFATNDSSADQGVGHGKTSTVVKCCKLIGGFLENHSDEKASDFRKRVINNHGSMRLVLLDNLKSLKLSSSTLEAMITGTEISGHRLFNGNASKPNYFTFAITSNGVFLSKDLAQRYMTVKVARPQYNCNWDAQIDSFIEEHRWAIIADIVSLLAKEGDQLPDEGSTRWAAWEKDVLSKCQMPIALRTLIVARSIENNDDLRSSAEFFDQLKEFFDSNQYGVSLHGEVYCFSHDILAKQLSEFYGKTIAKNCVGKQIKIMHAPWLRKMKDNHGRCTWQFHRQRETLPTD